MLDLIRDVYFPRAPLRYPFGWMHQVMPVKLHHLTEGLGIVAGNSGEREIVGVTCDSRKVKKGFAFVAIPGTKTDGHKYIDDAIIAGCAAIFAQKPYPTGDVPLFIVDEARMAVARLANIFYDEPSRSLNVIGITGTNGKSTTSFLVRSILESAGERVGLLGTITYSVGAKDIPAATTTPAAEDLQRYFYEMNRGGCASAVMEVSSHALSQLRVEGVRFASAVFTNLTRDHLDYHKTMDEYREAKGLLFRSLGKNAIAVVNRDDPAAEYFSSITDARVVTYGVKSSADVMAMIKQMGMEGTHFSVLCKGEDIPIKTRLVGMHNISNILAAVATCYSMGYAIDAIRAGVEKVVSVPGRLEMVGGGREFAVYVDYAHTDDALKNILGSLRSVVKGRLIIVFGCGGDRDRGKRPKMGKVVEEMADFSVVTSDNPRSEEPMAIIDEIQGGMTDRSRYHVEPDRYEAIKYAISVAREGDAVIVAGKGHENYQIFKDRTITFDDRLVVKELLQGRLSSVDQP